MSTIRVNKNTNYTVMSNYHLRDMNLSLKAKGLLCVMLSLPDNWDYTIIGLTQILKEGKDSIVSILNELENNGYLERMQVVDSKGRFAGYDYTVYEQPQGRNPCTENPYTDNPHTENPLQLNTNINKSTYTKILNTECIKENSNINIRAKEKKKRTRFVPPTYEKILEYANSRGRSDLAQAFYDYYTATEWHDSKGQKVKSWKGKFITWENNNSIKQSKPQVKTGGDAIDELLRQELEKERNEQGEIVI